MPNEKWNSEVSDQIAIEHAEIRLLLQEQLACGETIMSAVLEQDMDLVDLLHDRIRTLAVKIVQRRRNVRALRDLLCGSV